MHHVRIVIVNMYTRVPFIMLKSKGSLNEARNNISNANIWHSFTCQKDDHGNGTEESTMPKMCNLSIERFRDERNYSTNIGNMESFHCAIGPILNIAQMFGVFPVSGVGSSSPSKLQFKTFSFFTIYSTFVTMMVLFVTIVSVIYMIKTLNSETFQAQGGITAATAGAVFYGNSLLGMILFFWLSWRWAPLQCEWRAMERYIDRNSLEIPRLRWKFFLISSVILLLAFIEHVLSILNNTEGYEWSGSNSTFRGFLEVYSLRSHSFIFNILDYNFTFGLYIFVVSKLATFTWNFTDLFVMLVATGLAERYKSLNKKLAITVVKYRSRFDWHGIRENYAILSSMVKKLLNGLSSNGSSVLGAIYFFGSFAFLIGRTCSVTLLTARIHDQSREALPYLYNCSASSYSIEAQRLQYQLATDDVCLTGLRFFSITRNFMLAVAGAIVTYEIVLLQFNITTNK